MRVSFIIPVYGNFALTKACIDSLKRTVNNVEYEVIIVDDASDESTRENLLTLVQENIRVIRNNTNSGYSHSNNVGARNANGEILLLLNNDLELLDGWLEPMLQAFEKFENLGIIGNLQLNAKTGELDHAGQYIDWDTEIKHRRIPNTRFPKYDPYTKVHAITGACCAIRRKLFLSIGEFDEAFVNGCEDVDLCFRLLRKGYKVFVSNRSVVKHWVSSTRGHTSLNNEKNFRLLQRKWEMEIRRFASYKWPDFYMSHFYSDSRAFDFKLFRDAFPRWLTLIKSPSPTGTEVASRRIQNRERHWNSVIDGLSDEELKKKEHEGFTPDIKRLFDYKGLYLGENESEGLWIRDKASFEIPKGILATSISIFGNLSPQDEQKKEEHGKLGLLLSFNNIEKRVYQSIEDGSFEIKLDSIPFKSGESNHFEIELLGVSKTNAYAYLGRKLETNSLIPLKVRSGLQKFRRQSKNRRLRLHGIKINDEVALDFKLNPTSPTIFEFIKRYGNIGVNLVGWFQGQLGIGESARLSAKVLKASSLDYSLIPCKLNCLADQGDQSLTAELSDKSPYPINLFHVDPAQSLDIDHHHGNDLRKLRYNIAYWAWELPEFPDNWIKYFKPFNEIWVPSNFVRDSIAMKSPLPVVTMPHCIEFERPTGNYREQFNLPKDKFLFEFIYDLNSYQERKNPQAVIDAFRKAFVGTADEEKVGLIIKTQSIDRNTESYNILKAELADIKNAYIIHESLSRDNVYKLISCCDSYVSLHRSEGFGLTVAEAMYLKKPVISTDWSATTEFLTAQNGCPVNVELTKIEKTQGPYQIGQTWAHPNTSHAAEHMKALFKNPEYGKSLGTKAAETIEALFSSERIAQLYEKRIKAISLWK